MGVKTTKDDKLERDLRDAAGKGDFSTLTQLVEQGVNIQSADPQNGKTALMVAAKEGEVHCLDHLTTQGADVNAQNKDGNTALMYAAQGGHLDCVDHLIGKGADLDIQKYAVPVLANVNAIEWLGYTALMLAARGGRLECLDHLIAEGASLNAQDKVRRPSAAT